MAARTIFRDGFETNDFSAWTATPTGGAGTINVVADQSHHGTYSARGTGQFGAVDFGFCSRTINPESTIFLRSYVYFHNLPFPVGDRSVHVLRVVGAVGGIASIGLRRNGTDYMWRLEWYGAGAHHNSYSSVITPIAGRWYCIEVKVVVHDTQGEVRLYVDGIEVIAETGLKTDDRGNITFLYSGVIEINGNLTGVITVYTDCIIAADVLVGPSSIWEISPTRRMVHAAL